MRVCLIRVGQIEDAAAEGVRNAVAGQHKRQMGVGAFECGGSAAVAPAIAAHVLAGGQRGLARLSGEGSDGFVGKGHKVVFWDCGFRSFAVTSESDSPFLQ